MLFRIVLPRVESFESFRDILNDTTVKQSEGGFAACEGVKDMEVTVGATSGCEDGLDGRRAGCGWGGLGVGAGTPEEADELS